MIDKEILKKQKELMTANAKYTAHMFKHERSYPPLPGEILRDEGIQQVTEHNEDFVQIMKEKAVQYARENGIVSADDLHPIASALNLHPKHPNAWGSIFKDKRFKLYSFKNSVKTSRRCGLIRVWTLRDDYDMDSFDRKGNSERN